MENSSGSLSRGVFICPQIKQLFKDQQFEAVLSDKEKAAWQSFEKVSNGFLVNSGAANFRELLQHPMDSYEQLGCNMSLKMHFLFSQLDFFPLNCCDVRDECGEHCHQDISVKEHRYKGKLSAATLGDYCWMMKGDAPETNTIDRPKGHVVKVSNFLFLCIVHITMIVLLSRKQELTNEF